MANPGVDVAPRRPSLRQDAPMASLADLGITIGSLPTGPTNSIVDVRGVGLGHSTVVYDDPPPPFGRGVARTGVTVLDLGGDAWAYPVPAGVAVLNGAGELTGRSQVDEWGLLETPVFLTSTMQVGRVYDAACRLLMAEQPRIGIDDVIIPAVGECDDSWLNDPRYMHVTDEHVAAALGAARASAGSGISPEQGAVGAGTGLSCFGYKGGIGTSSRVLPDGHVLGVVLLTNFGQWDRLTIDGLPVGRTLGPPAHAAPPPAGSCIGVVVTDAPLDHSACERLARRVGLGLARAGSTAHHASGEIFLAVALGLRVPRGMAPALAPISGRALDPYFEAVVDATEEAVLISLLSAHEVTGVGGRFVGALPVEAVARLIREGRHS
ncbi:MAG: S58 family peptidase [Actinobacteria bacterium]|nr:S58 family peptidase [Actinomycetota bacterium]